MARDERYVSGRSAVANVWMMAAALGLIFPAVVSDAASETTLFAVAPPPFTEGIYPCSDCHAGQETNPERRELTDEHTGIALHHAEAVRWCLDCHDAGDRDALRLQSGERIAFGESHRLCGQCHGPTYRDWKAGVHGKRTGFWNGRKEYLLCAHCHDPHNPRFKPIKPDPPPPRPARWR
jgi:hypothetical protein